LGDLADFDLAFAVALVIRGRLNTVAGALEIDFAVLRLLDKGFNRVSISLSMGHTSSLQRYPIFK